MRLFVAVNFDEDTVTHLCKSTEILRENSLCANISSRENLHLTLAFIGEVPSAKTAISALQEVTACPFSLTLKGYGEFGKGRVCFAKTVHSQSLTALAENVRENLTSKGVTIDSKPFKPHITLARQFEPTPQFQKKIMDTALCAKTTQVKEISLMRSDRINGKLTYTEVFKKVLN